MPSAREHIMFAHSIALIDIGAIDQFPLDPGSPSPDEIIEPQP